MIRCFKKWGEMSVGRNDFGLNVLGVKRPWVKCNEVKFLWGEMSQKNDLKVERDSKNEVYTI